MIGEQMVTGIAETVLEDIETLEGIDTLIRHLSRWFFRLEDIETLEGIDTHQQDLWILQVDS